MKTLKFGLIGHPLGHSMSPFIHGKLFAMEQLEAEYTLLAFPPEEMEERYSMLCSLDGFNVTIPHKTGIIPYLDTLSADASLYGAVNTVKTGEQVTGYNTDCTGFLKALDLAGIPLSGRVLLCGAGGAGRMIAFECAKAGCALTIAVPDIPGAMEQAEALKAELLAFKADLTVSLCLLDTASGAFDLLVNATPAGMHPNLQTMPVSETVVSSCKAVYDLVYNPQETKLLKTAKKYGLKTAGGMSMLVLQAAAAHEIWFGTKFDPEDMKTLILQANEAMREQFGGR